MCANHGRMVAERERLLMQRQLPFYAGAPLTVMATLHRRSSCPHVVIGHLGRHHHLLLRLHTEGRGKQGEARQSEAGTAVCTGQGSGRRARQALRHVALLHAG